MSNNIASVTSQDVARVAQVSVGTVIKVLNNRPNVDNVLRARVLKVIDELGYIHVPKKRRSETEETESVNGRIKTISFCVPVRQTPALEEGYYYRILRGVENECAKLDIGIIYTTLEDNQSALTKIKTAQANGYADGLVLVTFGSHDFVKQVIALEIPLVLIDPREALGLDVNIVMNDYTGGSILAVRHLLELGHRKIALLNGPSRYSTNHRLEGYRSALNEAGLDYRPELVVTGKRKELSIELGQETMAELLSRNVEFSAVCTANDNMAQGAIRALEAVGRRVPEDVSVVGFDNHAAEFSTPPLTTIDADTEGKGSVAVQRLLEVVKNPQGRKIWSVLPVRLIARQSTMRYDAS